MFKSIINTISNIRNRQAIEKSQMTESEFLKKVEAKSGRLTEDQVENVLDCYYDPGFNPDTCRYI
ncbi:hypothetical protein QOZ96_003306 [Brevundimonas nasdae]|uniref:hypothetical protein n=1 Tax=Brevundimonas nasdae TaxID=172043 RepID=UPI0019114651|nr:hypothetical protein [Brevundimonas nasdae]MBK6026943.1 hypothetical protein [Brevundimonas nasdae]MDQ0453336.1 hypothetical protein [Brevundimonas nasdae]